MGVGVKKCFRGKEGCNFWVERELGSWFVVSLQRTSFCRKFSPIIESVVLLVVEVSFLGCGHHLSS